MKIKWIQKKRRPLWLGREVSASGALGRLFFHNARAQQGRRDVPTIIALCGDPCTVHVRGALPAT